MPRLPSSRRATTVLVAVALVVAAGVWLRPRPAPVASLMLGPVPPAERLENFDRLLRRLEQGHPGVPAEEWPEPSRQRRRDAEAGREKVLADHPELRRGR